MSEYDDKAEAFLAKFALKVRTVHHGDCCPKWDSTQERSGHRGCPQYGTIHGDRYRVTISRKGGGRVSFDFWNSLSAQQSGEDVTAYDVLACISSKAYCPDSFEDFCGEYGYEQDSRKALATFKRCAAFAERLRAFFSEDELEALSDIR